MHKVTASIVLYNTSEKQINSLLKSFLLVTIDIVVYIIDNSPNENLKMYFTNTRYVYISRKNNPGFGSSHNHAIKLAIKNKSAYHFVINPDITFNDDILTKMVTYMHFNPKVGMLMPEILNLDGTVQFLPKLLPSPWSLIVRKIKLSNFIFKSYLRKYELRNIASKKIINVPVLSGCFTLIRAEVFCEVGLYDEKYFLYFEDWDFSRRVHKKYLTLFFPVVSVYHEYNSGANKDLELFIVFIKSAFVYFSKWGWFSDKERKDLNKNAISQL